MQGGIRKRGQKWYYYFDITTPEGKQKRIERVAGKEKGDAQKALREAITNYENGYIEPKKETIKDYLIDWLENYIKSNRKINTYNRYKEILFNDIIPYIGNVLLKDIKPVHIDKMLNAGKKRGLSGTTLQNIYGVLNSALNRAVKLQIIINNPCKHIDRPKRDRFRANVLSVEQYDTILSMLSNNKYNNYIFSLALKIELELGLRRGELAGLQWKNIDFKNRLIHIDTNLIYSDSQVLVDTTKTEESERTLTVSKELIEALGAHKKVQSENRLKFGQHYIKTNKFGNQEFDFVMTWENGKYVHPNYYTHRWIKIKEKLNLDKNIRFHDLRHTNASLLLEQGVDFKVIQERLGHSDINTTLNIYSHVNLEMQKKATEKLAEILSSGKNSGKIKNTM